MCILNMYSKVLKSGTYLINSKVKKLNNSKSIIYKLVYNISPGLDTNN